ncbi:hypothetical protein [Acinetobacter pittii]|uniref:hypothetical protein n=1 Tax=Acinetobacter pittii TaxID=48296 RepID=UPI0005C586FF|nr:hypothetical protein [Acinetobacter pittii]
MAFEIQMNERRDLLNNINVLVTRPHQANEQTLAETIVLLNKLFSSLCQENLEINLKIKKEQPDTSRFFEGAPGFVKYWLKDPGSNKCWWTSKRPKKDLEFGRFLFNETIVATEAPDFGYDGPWDKSLVKRPCANQ